MKPLLSLAALAALGACGRSVDMYPVGTGTGGTGGSTLPDAAVPDTGTSSTGRVCLINDARSPGTCATTGANGLTVTLGSYTTTTADDGSFSIVTPSGTDLVWRVTGTADVQAAAMALSSGTTIPALSLAIYNSMIVANQAIANDGSGAVIARITMGGAGVSGLQAAPTPLQEGAIYYDGASATVWQETSTGSFGVVWIPGLAPTSTAQIALSGSHTATITGIPIFADTVTFAFATVQ